MDSSASQPSLNLSKALEPLQIKPSGSVDPSAPLVRGVGVKPAEDGEPERPESHPENQYQLQRPLTSKQEGEITRRINEISQLHSPQLRELAKRLGSKYNIQTPQPKRHSNLGGGGRHPYSDYHLGQRWQEIQGCYSWDGLLDPIDPVLRAEIVRYGEFAEACYDAFDNDKYSKYRGSCKYTKESLLEKVGLDNRGYEITHYLYSTADSKFLLKVDKNVLRLNHDSDPELDGIRNSSWMGFVAVCTSPQEIDRLGRRDIVVAWRGTETTFEWIQNIQDYLQPSGFDTTVNQGAQGTQPRPKPDDVCMEAGFLNIYRSSNLNSRYDKRSVGDQVHDAIKDLVAKYGHEGPNLSITVTGHSLGSALATICGYYISQLQINCPSTYGIRSTNPGQHAQNSQPEGNPNLKHRTFTEGFIPVTVYCFAGPRVGNEAFKNRVKELGVAVLRVENAHDVVTRLPGKGELLKDVVEKFVLPKYLKLPLQPTYEHVGVTLEIDHTKSDKLMSLDTKKLAHVKALSDYYARVHNLEAYLHVVDGYHGIKEQFKPTLRDFSLVNKRCDFLRPELWIPPKWWQEENKGLQKTADGRWEVPERDTEIYPNPDDSSEQADNLVSNVRLAMDKSLEAYFKGYRGRVSERAGRLVAVFKGGTKT